MAANYVLLERIELNASAASVTFSNIPQSGYTDLKIVVSARTSFSGASNYDYLYITINGDTTAANYPTKMLLGNGSAANSYGNSTQRFAGDTNSSTSTANTFSNGEIYIPNYNSTSAYKSISVDAASEANATATEMGFVAMTWNSNSAINSIALASGNSGNLLQYSTFSLYGLAATGTTPVIAPKASGGNITTDGTYWYHTFLASGSFTPATNLTCDALVVAGGGGGGIGYGAGGGAGGVQLLSNQTLTPSSYTVTVGAGGPAGQSSNTSGTQGGNSQLGSLTASIGGGYGGGNTNGGNGGSGGGGARTTGGTGTSGQGNNGGTGGATSAGGGGGAGSAGGNGSGGNAGNGGAGTNAYSSWLSITGLGVAGYIAGGGGAVGSSTNSPGGSGGAGNGFNYGAPYAATANTGSGGGGDTTSGTGGSGFVIVRYTVA